ncbi:MAG: BPSS1780 family membrane protein [Brachymonas sp.]
MNDGFPTSLEKNAAPTPPSSPPPAYGPQLLSQPRACDAGAGTRWLSQAWTLFTASPGLWLGMGLVLLVAIMVLSLIPGVSLLVNLGFGVIAAGWIIGAYELDENQNLQFEHLFAGFKRNTGQLLLLGVLYFAALLAVALIAIVVVAIFGGFSGGMALLLHGDRSALGGAMLLGILLGSLIFLALIVPAVMAIWFAPALVALNDMPAIDAMKLSFKACMANLVPFLLYGLVLMVLTVVAIIPCGLGLLVLLPIMYISYYTSYREVLTHN